MKANIITVQWKMIENNNINKSIMDAREKNVIKKNDEK